MNLIVISNCQPLDLLWLDRVHQEMPIQLIIKPAWPQAPNAKSRWKKFREAPWRTLTTVAQRKIYDRYGTRLNHRAGQLLFGEAGFPRLDVKTVSIPAWDLNSTGTEQLITSLKPNLIIVSGAPKLKPNIFDIPKSGTVNVHRGISPHYRGENTLFWPLYFRDYEHIGVTLHFIDEQIDTGPVIAQGYPALGPDDNELTLFTKCARLAADLLLEFLRSPQRPLLEQAAQIHVGRQYYQRERTFDKDVRYWLRRRLLRERPPARNELRTWFVPKRLHEVDVQEHG